MSDQYLGEIRPTAFSFAPYGWALCQGQLLSVAQNTALFSLLGTFFGGDGVATFGLPNLCGRVGVGIGQGGGLSPYTIGETGGDEGVSLTTDQMPMHTHTASANGAQGGNPSPEASVWTQVNDGTGGSMNTYAAPPANVTLPITLVSTVGGNQPLNTMQPSLVVNYIIALQGIFPTRP